MAYEQSKFGDGSAAGSGNVVSTVSNHYGARDTGGFGGVSRTAGFENEMTLVVTPEMIEEENFTLVPFRLPKGALIKSVYAEVEEAFVIGGTSPALDIGTEGSEATNGFTTTEAQLEAVGAYDLTSALSGTWADPLTADTLVGIAFSGTSPTVTDVGKVKFVVTYMAGDNARQSVS